MKTLSVAILLLFLNSACSGLQTHFVLNAPVKTKDDTIVYSPEEQLIQACDTALNDCKKANDSKSEVIKGQQELLLTQEKQISDLREADKSIFKSTLLWFFLGILTMGVAQAI